MLTIFLAKPSTLLSVAAGIHELHGDSTVDGRYRVRMRIERA